jgi:1-acyl-sn-glycerol-3-phosphate acyltransferase
MEPVYLPIIGLARTVFALQGLRFTMVGQDNVPRTGGAVMAINHTGYMDFTYAGLAARKSRRLVRFMAKESIFGHRYAGPLMRGMKHIPVDRHKGTSSFRQAVEVLRAGEIVGVFPEATISRSFEIKEFKSGTVRMAQLAGVPILPTTIWGSQRVWTKEHPKRMGRSNIDVFVTVGEPMVVPRDADAEEANDRLRATMTAQLHAQQAAYPPLHGDELGFVPARLGGTAPTPEEAHQRDEHDRLRHRDEFTG